jgi:uncharacterized protein YceK
MVGKSCDEAHAGGMQYLLMAHDLPIRQVFDSLTLPITLFPRISSFRKGIAAFPNVARAVLF